MDAQDFRVLLPVQDLDAALPRMRVAPALRRELALAFARDTAAAALGCDQVAEVVVLTRDHRVAAAFSGADVQVLAAAGSRHLGRVVASAYDELDGRRSMPTAVLVADLPTLMPAELGSALRRVFEGTWSVYAEDARSARTTFFASRPATFAPALGRRSGAANAAAGSLRIGRDLPGLRHDVDTLEDLTVAKHLGLGVHTGELLARKPRRRSLRLAA